MNTLLRFTALYALLGALLLGLAGCDGGSTTFTPEESEPGFERGRMLVRQGRNPEALASFLKVIAKRGDDAPESHLEAALIYRQHIKDQLAAIYHFRKYIELQPNSRQAELVRNQIQAATREFARTLPAHPLEDQSVRLSYQDQLDRLQRENEQLKSEIAALRAGIAANPAPQRSFSQGRFEISNNNGAVVQPDEQQPRSEDVAIIQEPETGGDPDTPFVHSPLTPTNTQLIRAPEVASRPAATQPATAATTAPTKPAQAEKPAAKEHIVASGDTLSTISLKYYGTRGRAKDIQAANKDVLKGGDRLSIGMKLRLP